MCACLKFETIRVVVLYILIRLQHLTRNIKEVDEVVKLLQFTTEEVSCLLDETVQGMSKNIGH